MSVPPRLLTDNFPRQATDRPESLEEGSCLHLFGCLFCQRKAPGNVVSFATAQMPK
jgi:hypothetical protein